MIDFDKPITTRCGYPVEIWTTEASYAKHPIQGAYTCGNTFFKMGWEADGKASCSNREIDLINVPEEIEGWVNIYLPGNGRCSHLYETKEQANSYADKNLQDKRIACIKVKFKRGEGL